MQLRNTSFTWGLISVLLHWLIALTIFGLFGLGLWMTGLDYYDTWYKTGPDIHRSVGILLLIAIIFRLGWKALNTTPSPHPNHKAWELKSAHGAHILLSLLPLALMLSGYLISTADGRPISVFSWFDVPAVFTGLNQQEEIMGKIHFFLAWGLIITAGIHALGALKHHIIDHDTTLTRMLGFPKNEEQV